MNPKTNSGEGCMKGGEEVLREVKDEREGIVGVERCGGKVGGESVGMGGRGGEVGGKSRKWCIEWSRCWESGWKKWVRWEGDRSGWRKWRNGWRMWGSRWKRWWESGWGDVRFGRGGRWWVEEVWELVEEVEEDAARTCCQVLVMILRSISEQFKLHSTFWFNIKNFLPKQY